MAKARPVIERVARPSAPRKAVREARPGDVLRIDGKGFGTRAASVRVLFDAIEVPPFAEPFAETSLHVTAPLPDASTRGLAVRVGRVASEVVPFRVVRRRQKRPPRSDTLEFLQALDEYTALVATTARRAADSGPFAAELTEAAANLDGCRRVMQRNAELLLQWRAVQATPVARAAPMEAVRTIERIDETVRTARMTAGMKALTANTFGRKSAFATRSGVSLASWAIQGIGNALVSVDLDTIAFVFTEGAKLIEVYEQVVKVFSLSFSIGGTGGIAVLNGVVLGDVGLSPGEGISAIAKGVDIVAQILERLAGDPAQDKLDRLELKADLQQVVLEGFRQRTADELVRLGELIDRIEAKADRVQQDAADLRAAIDAQFARAEEKLDRAEGKADRDTEKLDALEAKSDRMEAKADRDTEKLDILEAKADRAGAALERLEGKADAHEVKLDRIEEKADRLETKADRAEEKLDRLESKADQEESKLDRLEGKADREETKLDRLEGKADRAEGKLDRLEAKLDIIEPKLDRLEAKADRPLPIAPHEGAVAAQRGGAINVTAVVAATRGADNRVYLRAAIDVAPQALDDETAWSQWIDFGRPAAATAIIEASVSASYVAGSNDVLDALLSVRDAAGRVFHRAFEARPDDRLLAPSEWTDWAAFLGQP